MREPALTATDIEERFLASCLAAGLPRPEVNSWLATDDVWVRADFLWRSARLVVETDGRAAHGTRQAFERDRRRDQRLAVAGYRTVRFTWRQLHKEAQHVTATIGALLGRGADAP